MSKYIVTGNEFVALPEIQTETGAIESVTILHMGYKGLLELRGTEQEPLLSPFVSINGKDTPITSYEWRRDQFWVPSFTAKADGMEIEGTILCPVGERGFGFRLKVSGGRNEHCLIRLGLRGMWGRTLHTINESKPVNARLFAYESAWNHKAVFDIRGEVSILAFAPIYDDGNYEYETDDGRVSYKLWHEIDLQPGETAERVFWFGVGVEEVAAATSAKEMLRQGFAGEYKKTIAWLTTRSLPLVGEKLRDCLNVNLFFSLFFSTGITVDTEELVLVTSRSPRYYVSAAYWDRDSLLWSFPAILLADAALAREMLQYVFTRQIKNVGIHSRYIDGTVLEPGFELDELCAPVLALARYVQTIGDTALLQEGYVLSGIERILRILEQKKHPRISLYETLLQPTDDMHVYKYITYDNVLVWRMLTDLAELYGGIWPQSRLETLLASAEAVRNAVMTHCIKIKDGKRIYAWSVDLAGNWDVYDEPPGSLLLLPYYGFCSEAEEVWNNTVAVIRDPAYPYSFSRYPIAEIGCPHAPHPWVLSIANSLLSGNAEKALKHLQLCTMDNGIACESVDEITGESRTGDAFATCAGFLAYALYTAMGEG